MDATSIWNIITQCLTGIGNIWNWITTPIEFLGGAAPWTIMLGTGFIFVIGLWIFKLLNPFH